MSDQEKEKVSFKNTLNLPQTDFPIRANPTSDDPLMINRWKEEHLDKTSFTHNEGSTKYIIHDGPPYANGHIHLGHAYNKILKDIQGKAQRMSGKQVPITPGWDCHGLPIEIQVVKEHPNLEPMALKKACRAHANKWIDIQREEFKRLGVLMNWEHPYKTMDPHYEASILRAFGIFVAQGLIQKKKKTVAWCASCKTVLATAEIEYHERKDPSIYVMFPLLDETIKKELSHLSGSRVGLIAWTTTPWTLPLNRAVVIKTDTVYDVIELSDNEYGIVAHELVDSFLKHLGKEKKVIAQVHSSQLKNNHVQHPFIENLTVPIILDPSVSLTDGTACVHCAPGCGPDDYEIAIKNNLDIYSPLTVDGRYARGIEPEELEGMAVTDAHGWVIKKLIEKNTLIHKESIKHSYPHCWRCRNGLIFRATSQWFCDLTKHGLKEKALAALNEITFLPPQSINYLKATLESRLEWCLSRQRVWGVPIPALLCKTCNHAIITPEIIEKVASGIEHEGIEYWDKVSIDELVGSYVCHQCQSIDFEKERDILDVWFDAGVSHYAVLLNNKELQFPADIYIEGIDQHRGWFQSSLLTSMVIEKKPCTKSFLTHGFTVDEKGHKMSKSLGNVVTPDEIIKQIGTDGLRLWVSSINYEGDAAVSKALLDNVAEVYRKIRNTCRFLLSNLYDFDAKKDMLPINQLLIIDRYALEKLFLLNVEIKSAYEQSDFTAVFHQLADYCTKELSAFYLDIIKDRLYVEQNDGPLRRSAQTVCWYILDTLTHIIAPILSFTAEQISDHYQHNKDRSIHLQSFNDLHEVWQMIIDQEQTVQSAINWYPFKAHAQETMERIKALDNLMMRAEQWQLLIEIRNAVLKALEEKREQGLIKHSLEAQVTLYLNLEGRNALLFENFIKELEIAGETKEQFFKEFFIVSQCNDVNSQEQLQPSEMPHVWIRVDHAQGVKCPRCWQWNITNNVDNLCNRCQIIISKKML